MTVVANERREAPVSTGHHGAAKVDGRRERSAESRRRILAAGRKLIQEGKATPTAEQIAAEAGVSLRTVFRHFEEMDRLSVEIVQEVLEDSRPLMEAPLDAGDERGRLEELLRRRATTFEQMLPFVGAIAVNRARSERVEARYRDVMAGWSRQVAEASPDAVREAPERLAALDMVLSPEAWMRLRHVQGLSSDEADSALRAAAHLLSGLKPRAN
ncbi:MAG: TetR/AcrR family transcriptional regulator [Thermaurantiacus sp.]